MNRDEDDEIAMPRNGGEDGKSTARSRAELDAMIEMLWGQMQAQQAQIEHLRRAILGENEREDNSRLARWLPFPPPPAAEDKQHPDATPLFTIAHFVQYYNAVYVGKPGSRAIAIPDCWLEHPALVAELATLTYTWRDAHLGKTANPRDAQYWHDRWRVGFADRLAAEWVHPHCLSEGHKQAGAASLLDRYTDQNGRVN